MWKALRDRVVRTIGLAGTALVLAGGCGSSSLPPAAASFTAPSPEAAGPVQPVTRLFRADAVPSDHLMLGRAHRWPAHRFYDSGRQTVGLESGSMPLGRIVRAEALTEGATGVMVYGQSGDGTVHRRFDFEVPVTQAALDGFRLEFGPGADTTAMVRAIEIVPTPWEFTSAPITVPRQGVLEFSYAIEEWSPAPAHLRAFVQEGDSRTLVWEHVVGPEQALEGWQDVAVDLDGWTGREVRLVFRTELSWVEGSSPPAGAWTRPAWGSAIVYPASRDSSAGPRTPNIVLISIDTLRADRLGAYGHTGGTTPNMDAFAETGVVFTNALAPSSWTLPSHAAMMSGLDPTQQPRSDEHFYRLDDEMDMLAEYAAGKGYLTAGFTDGVLVGGDMGFAQGFDRYYDGRGHVDAPPASSIELFDRSMAWLDDHGHLPFFLFVHTFEVHWPYEPIEPYLSRFAPGIDPEQVGMKDHAANMQLYEAEIAHTDHQVGRFLAHLRALGLMRNTVVILTSDHGEEFGERGHVWHMNTVNRESVHVPLIVHLPSDSTAPARVERPVSITDLFATLLDAMEIGDAARYDSHSLMPLLRSGVPADAYSRKLVPLTLRQLHEHRVVAGGTRGRVKYIAEASINPDRMAAAAPGAPQYDRAELNLLEWLASGGSAGERAAAPYFDVTEYLFDVAADPGETRNVLDREPALADAERARLLGYLRGLSAVLPERGGEAAPSAPLGDEEREDLEALGYL